MQTFRKINHNLGVFNDFSAKRFNDINKDFEKHIKMLITMKNDLDSIFRRIRWIFFSFSF